MSIDTVMREDETGRALKLMTTASTPATPGPSTPIAVRPLPLDRMDDEEDKENIVPPARPSSTPFPQQELLEGGIQCPRHVEASGQYAMARRISLQSHYSSVQMVGASSPRSFTAPTTTSALCNLPVEIHECILDHLFGVRLSASATMRTSSSGGTKALRGWSTALRHSRRRDVWELALVTEKWRQLIQERLYRHIKIKGTRESVEQTTMWFESNPHLCRYVKHIEFWFPVFQQRSPATRTLRILTTTNPSTPTVTSSLSADAVPTYQSPNNNCTLDEVFAFVRYALPEACVLSLEGGERKKPPMVRQFRDASSRYIPVLEKITTLVCKSQWNLIRTREDFENIAVALPNLTEWHGSYARGKSKSYLCMSTILPSLPHHLTNLSLCLESDFRREAVSPAFWGKVCLTTHFCVDMARAMPALEHFAYTGRVCHSFFDTAASWSNPRNSRLKTIDIVVRNVCRPTTQWNNGSGITDMSFIMAFEALVISAARSLGRLAAVELVQIKFIDLGEYRTHSQNETYQNPPKKLTARTDSIVPSLNPYFQFKNNKCTGIWSDEIVEALSKARPSASFAEKSEVLAEEMMFKDGQLLRTTPLPRPRPDSIKVASYMTLFPGITIT